MRRFFLLSACLYFVCSATGDPVKVPRPELALQIGQSLFVNAVALSPDGSLAVSSDGENAIKVWDTRSGETLYSLHEPLADYVSTLKFSPDGSLMAVATQRVRGDNTPPASIKLYRPRSGTLVHMLAGVRESITALAFSPDGKWLAAASRSPDFCARLWSLENGQLTQTFQGPVKWIHALTFAQKGQALVGVSAVEKVVCHWDLQRGTLLRTAEFEAAEDSIAVLSADGTLMAVGDLRTGDTPPGPITVRETTTGKSVRLLADVNEWVNALEFAPDNRTLVSASFNQKTDTLRLWNVATGALVRAVTKPHEQISRVPQPDPTAEESAFSYSIDTQCVAFSGDGKTLISGALNGSLMLWDTSETLKARRPLRGRDETLFDVAFSADGRTVSGRSVSLFTRQTQLRDWDLQAGVLRNVEIKRGFVLAIDTLSPNGALRVHYPLRGDVQLWDERTGKRRSLLQDSDVDRTQHTAFLGDGKTLVGGSGKSLRLWDIATGQVLQTQEAHAKPIKSVVCSPDGKLLATVSAESIRLWDVSRATLGEPVRIIERPDGGKLLDNGGTSIVFARIAMAFGPDNVSLAVTSADKVMLYNVRTGQLVRTFEGQGGRVRSVAFSPDGRRLATGGDNTLKIWNASSGRLLATFFNFPSEDSPRPAATEDYLVVTPEGYYAGSATADRYVRFRLGDTLYPAESFQARYYRPDLVKKALAGEELPPIGTFKGPFPPLAAFLNPPHDFKITGNSVTLSLATTDDSTVQTLAYFINGARVEAKPLTSESRPLELGAKAIELGAKAIELGAKALELGAKPLENTPRESTAGARQSIPNTHKTMNRLTVMLPLPVGESDLKVQVIAFDDDSLQSPRDELRLTRDTVVAPPVGKLLGLCVGVSRYQITSLNLRYADADATALTSDFNLQKILYNPPQIEELTNEAATAGAITAALDKLIDTTTPNDTVLISLSGHGWRDEQNKFYFATHEVDRKNIAQSALPWSAVMERLTKISQKSKRVIVLLDACHSGSAATNEELVKATLAANAGVMIFASSRGNEVSLEDAAWGHGAFTKALREAVQGLAAAPEEKHVTTLDFIAYVSRRVKQLTGNQQHPQVPFLQDFDTDAPLIQNP